MLRRRTRSAGAIGGPAPDPAMSALRQRRSATGSQFGIRQPAPPYRPGRKSRRTHQRICVPTTLRHRTPRLPFGYGHRARNGEPHCWSPGTTDPATALPPARRSRPGVARDGGSGRRASRLNPGLATRLPRGGSARHRRPCPAETPPRRPPARRGRCGPPRPQQPTRMARHRPRQPQPGPQMLMCAHFTVCWQGEDSGDRGGGRGLRRPGFRPVRPRWRCSRGGDDLHRTAQRRRVDDRGRAASVRGGRQAVPPLVHSAVGADRPRA